MKKYYIAYYSRNTYKTKIIIADSANHAIKKARVKNIIDVKEIVEKEYLAYINPSKYIYI